MRRCDSVIQKVLLQGEAAQKAQERDILFLRYIYLDGTRPETRKKTAEVCWLVRSWTETGSHRAVLGSRVRRYSKNLEIFMACLLFSTF